MKKLHPTYEVSVWETEKKPPIVCCSFNVNLTSQVVQNFGRSSVQILFPGLTFLGEKVIYQKTVGA